MFSRIVPDMESSNGSMPGEIKTSKLFKGAKKIRTLRYKCYYSAIFEIITADNIFN
jgi:hypothetical protein